MGTEKKTGVGMLKQYLLSIQLEVTQLLSPVSDSEHIIGILPEGGKNQTLL